MSFAWLIGLLPVLSVSGKACFPDLSSRQNLHYTTDQSPVTAIQMSVWLPPTTQSSSLLAVSAEERCLLSILSLTTASFRAQTTPGTKAREMILPDVAETEWKILTLSMVKHHLSVELSVCLAYSQRLWNCVKSHLEEELQLDYTSFDISLSANVPAHSLEVHTNDGNWRKHVANAVSRLRSSHQLSTISPKNQAINLLNSREDTSWEFVGFLAASTSQYVEISGRFFFNQNTQKNVQEVLTFDLFTLEEDVAEGVLTYSRDEGLQACIRLPNRLVSCSPWANREIEKWTQVVLRLATAYHPVMELCIVEEEISCYSNSEILGNRLMNATSFGVSVRNSVEFIAQALTLTVSEKKKDSFSFIQLPVSFSKQSRVLQTTHYAMFSYTGQVSHNSYKYFTFYNTHTATSLISVQVVPMNSSDPDLGVAKNFVTTYDYWARASGRDSIMIYPTDPQIVSKGGITGLFTVSVLGFSASEFCLRVTISCTQTSGNCYCASGYYPNPSTASCSACPVGSVLCQNFEMESCLPMSESTSYVNDSFYCTSGACVYSCSNLCLTCSGTKVSDCDSCKSNARLESSAPSVCICSSHFFPNPNAATCTACDSTCLQCNGGTAQLCTECKSFASLQAASPSACQCDFGAFPSPDPSNCLLCSLSCLSCSSESPNDCLSCAKNAHLQGSIPSACVCDQALFPNPNASQCSPCNDTCQSCSDTLLCLSCKSNAELHQGICKCASTFVGSPDAANCIACPQGCASCTLEACLSCSTGNFMYESECVTSCPSGYIRTIDPLGCEVSRSPIPQLIVELNNSLTVQFNKPMNATLTSEDISIGVTDQIDQFSAEWASPLFVDNQTLIVALFFANDYLPNGTSVTLVFIFPEKVIDYQNVAIEVQMLSGTLYAMGNPPSNTSSMLQSALAQQTAAAAAGGVAANMISSVFSGSPTSLLATFAQFQLIAYLSLSPLPLSDNFAGALTALNVNNMLPNPLANFLTHNYSSQIPNESVSKSGIETTLLIPNIVSLASMSLLVLCSYVPIKLGAALQLGAFSTYCERSLLAFKWAVPLNICITLYLDLGIYSLLQAINGSFSNLYLSFNTLCAYVMAASFLVAPMLIAIFILKRNYMLSTRSDDSFNERWSVFLSSFAPSKPLAGPIFYFIFFTRRFVFVITLFTLPAKYFALFYFSLSVSVFLTQAFIYVLARRPFVLVIDNIQAMAAEGGTMTVSILAGLYALNLSKEAQAITDAAGVWTVRVILLSSTGLSVVKLCYQIAKAFLKYKRTANMILEGAIRP